MCHPPAATAMERHKTLVEIRKGEIIFPSSFDKEKQTQVCTNTHESAVYICIHICVLEQGLIQEC